MCFYLWKDLKDFKNKILFSYPFNGLISPLKELYEIVIEPS